jgi:hypothetical protein
LPYPIDKNSLLGEVNIQKRELCVKGILSQHLRELFRVGLGQLFETAAVKRVIASQIEREIKRRKLTKTAMAGRMKTSRAGLGGYWTPVIGRSLS